MRVRVMCVCVCVTNGSQVLRKQAIYIYRNDVHDLAHTCPHKSEANDLCPRHYCTRLSVHHSNELHWTHADTVTGESLRDC